MCQRETLIGRASLSLCIKSRNCRLLSLSPRDLNKFNTRVSARYSKFSMMTPSRGIKTGTNGPLHRVARKKRDEHPRSPKCQRSPRVSGYAPILGILNITDIPSLHSIPPQLFSFVNRPAIHDSIFQSVFRIYLDNPFCENASNFVQQCK